MVAESRANQGEGNFTNRIDRGMKKTRFTQAVLALFTIPILLIFVSTSSTSAAGPTIRPGSTTSFAVLASTTITNTGTTTISGTAGGDIGLSPGTSFTGSASVTTNGTSHITDSSASTAQTDFTTAYNDLGVPAATVLAAPDLAGQTISAGTYKTAGGTFANSGTLTLDAGNDPNAIFIFQAASTLTTSTSSTMTLINGAQACHVYWQVGSSATIGVTSTLIGHVYAAVSITAKTGATIKGQLLAHTGAVTLDTNTIVNDNCSVAPPPASASCTSSISNLQFTTGGAGATTGKLTWTTSGPGLFQYTGDPSLYPAPFNYGTRTATWDGSLVKIVPTTSYPVTVQFFGSCGSISQASVVVSNAAAVATPTPTPVATPTTPPVGTVNGGKLPKTGSPWYDLLALSAGLLLVGGLGLYSRKLRNN